MLLDCSWLDIDCPANERAGTYGNLVHHNGSLYHKMTRSNSENTAAKLATGVTENTDSLKDMKQKRGQKSFWGSFERADSAKVQRYFWNRRSQFEEAVKRLSR